MRIYLQAARTAQNGTDDGRKRNRRGERLEEHRTDRVPNLELDGLVVDGDHAGAKLDADGEVVHGLEALVGELQQQARLADACASPPPRADQAKGSPSVPLRAGQPPHVRVDWIPLAAAAGSKRQAGSPRGSSRGAGKGGSRGVLTDLCRR